MGGMEAGRAFMTGLDSIQDKSLIQEVLFFNLSAEAQALFNQLSRLECGYLILYFLHSDATTRMTVDDIAYHVSQPVDLVEKDLFALEDLGLVQMMLIANITFYSLTTNPKRRQLVCELWEWQARWDTRIRQIQRLIWGNHSLQWNAGPWRNQR